MNLDFNQYIIPGVPDIVSRFNHAGDIRNKLFLVNEDFESFIWNKLKDEKFIKSYELCDEKFLKFEQFDFSHNYSLINKKFKTLPKEERVLLIWNAGFNSFITDLDTLMKNWKNFYYPSSDDIFLIGESLSWIAYISHYEYLFIG